MVNETRKVAKPPIIDALVLFRFSEKAFSEAHKQALQKFYPLKNEDFLPNVKNPLHGMFQKEGGQQSIIVGKSSLALRDGRKYKDLETLLNSIQEVWNAVKLDEISKFVTEIRFRVINKFDVPAGKLRSDFPFLPSIRLSGENPLLSGMDFAVSLTSELRGAFADIEFIIEPKTQGVLELIFDIDTYLPLEGGLLDFDSYRTYMKRLSDLKNDIFYTNIPDAEERFA